MTNSGFGTGWEAGEVGWLLLFSKDNLVGATTFRMNNVWRLSADQIWPHVGSLMSDPSGHMWSLLAPIQVATRGVSWVQFRGKRF